MALDFDRHNGAFLRHLGAPTPATYTHAAGGSAFPAVYVRSAISIAFPDGAANAIEAIWVRRSSLTRDPANGDTVEIGEKTYRVVSIRDDRAGGAYLALH